MAATCSNVASATGAILAPTTTQELATGIAATRDAADPGANRLHRLRPPAGLQEPLADLLEQIDELTFQFRLLEDAAEQEAQVTEGQLADAQRALTVIDEASARVDVPECASASWGRAYVEASIGYVATQLPMPAPATGDFVADATAACGRFYERFAGIPVGAAPPTDPAEYAAFLQTLEDAYDQLVTDLRALTPPPGSEADFADVIELIALAGESVDRAERDPRQLPDLERPLGAIGAELGPLVRILGFSC